MTYDKKTKLLSPEKGHSLLRKFDQLVIPYPVYIVPVTVDGKRYDLTINDFAEIKDE